MNPPMIARRTLLCATLAVGLARVPATAASRDCSAGIDEQTLRDYLDSFNRGEHRGYARFYADDVTLDVVGKQFLRGAAEVIAFYSQVRSSARRTILIDRLDFGENVIAAQLRSEFVAVQDDPHFIAGPLRVGDRIRLRTFVFYELARGKFKRIRSAEFSKIRPAANEP